jgi:hypothetical protein
MVVRVIACVFVVFYGCASKIEVVRSGEAHGLLRSADQQHQQQINSISSSSSISNRTTAVAATTAVDQQQQIGSSSSTAAAGVNDVVRDIKWPAAGRTALEAATLVKAWDICRYLREHGGI